ncbi:MAG: S9 family peptidase [Bryobacteraceae bacterium]|nr:S9 family peptidase [Bryobacteraceae bacterium]
MPRSILALLLCLSVLPAEERKPFTLDALLSLVRISEPQVSPDGKSVAFTVQSIDVEKNTRPRQIWTVGLDGGAPVQVTGEGNNSRPRWTPDSKSLVFVSDRGGSSQIWRMNADGSDAKQLTSIATEASGVLVSPDGKHLVFTSDVYPDCADEACNKRRLEEEKASKVKARVYTSLLYRHWSDWQGSRRKHLFVVPADGGAPKDLTPGPRDVPPFSLGGPDDYAISPDGTEVMYAMNADADLATSTNSDLFAVPIGGGESKKVTLNPGADQSPLYSPDGKWLAYRSQQRAGYESDRWRLVVMERSSGRTTTLTESIDRPVTSIAWTPDSQRIAFTVEDRGRQIAQLIPVNGGGARGLIQGAGHVDDVQFTSDGKTLLFTESSGTAPVEIYKIASTGGSPVALTKLNDALLAQHAMSPLEEIWVDSPDGAKVHAFLLKPAGFDAKKAYPGLFLIHGGPQGAWGQTWSYRWNPQVFASAGYVVVMPNPRGSVGYGQKFTDEINADWGGKVYDDIMAVVDRVTSLPYVDKERLAAAGGSYGGYMVNWLLGHTDRFRAFVSHAGVFDLRSMAGETEELWFPTWEFRGMPWDNPEIYARWSPSYYVKDFKTPTLVIHGELDYRVPVGQGLQLFTALQMQKVPSKMLLFPDEGHWILKPQNSRLWYNSFLDWVGEWTRKK